MGSALSEANAALVPGAPALTGMPPSNAILDRLLHHASALNLEGDSFRLKEKRRAGQLGRAPSAPAPTLQESHADNPIHSPLADPDSQPRNGHSH